MNSRQSWVSNLGLSDSQARTFCCEHFYFILLENVLLEIILLLESNFTEFLQKLLFLLESNTGSLYKIQMLLK